MVVSVEMANQMAIQLNPEQAFETRKRAEKELMASKIDQSL
jgi:hypothetical protein